jgi:hypothetical protein
MVTHAAIQIDPERRIDLTINPEKVYFIIDKSREFDVKVAPEETDSDLDSPDDLGSNATDSGQSKILEDYANDPTGEELKDAIDALNDDEKIDLITLCWLGRGDYGEEEWDEARRLAEERRTHTSQYLMGIPTLCDFLEEGMSMLGHFREGEETERLPG